METYRQVKMMTVKNDEEMESIEESIDWLDLHNVKRNFHL